MHRAKGLQWDCVIIPNCLDNCLPMPGNDSDIDAERRVFYVGITRAKKTLYLINGDDTDLVNDYWHDVTDTLPTKRQSSQFIYELKAKGINVAL